MRFCKSRVNQWQNENVPQHIKFKFILFRAQNDKGLGFTSGAVVTSSVLRPLKRVRKNLKPCRGEHMGSLSSPKQEVAISV